MQALFETVRNIFGSDTVPWAVKVNDDAASGINGSRVLLVEDNFLIRKLQERYYRAGRIGYCSGQRSGRG